MTKIKLTMLKIPKLLYIKEDNKFKKLNQF